MSLLWQTWVSTIGLVAAVLLMPACQSTTSSTTHVPPPPIPVTELCQDLLGTALENANQNAHLTAEAQLADRWARLTGYVNGVRAAIDTFRTDLPRTDAEAVYDMTASRAALVEAERASAALMADLPAVAMRLAPALDRSAAFLDRLERTLDAVDNLEPRDDPNDFMQRYQALIDAYNRWAETSDDLVDWLNEQRGEIVIAPDAAVTWADAYADLWGGTWADDLSDACRSNLRRDDDEVEHRRLALHGQLIELAGLRSETPLLLSEPCRAVVSPLVTGFDACQVLIDAEGEPSRSERHEIERTLRRSLASFKEERAAACSPTP